MSACNESRVRPEEAELPPPGARFKYGFTNLISLAEVSGGVVGLYDVIDHRGHRVRQLRLEPGTRILGFGVGCVYTVTTDDVDLQYLGRHRW